MAFVVKKITGRVRRPDTRSSRSACVLLTATINPPQDAVARNNPELRLSDYSQSLRFYLGLPAEYIDRILFIDNSASNLDPLEKVINSTEHDKLVELISFAGNNHPVGYGKAYGEFKLIDFGLEHTTLLAPDDLFWKVTGRLKVLNLADILTAVRRRDYDILCDLYSFPLVGTGKLFGNRWMDLRLFSCSVNAYQKHLAHQYEASKNEFNQELLYKLVINQRNRLKLVPRFPIQPVVSGFSGRHDRDYHGGLQRIKTTIRSGVRRIVPFIWV